MKRKYLALSDAALKFRDNEILLLAIKEDRLRLRGRHDSQWLARPSAPEAIPTETIHNSEIIIEDDLLRIDQVFVNDVGFDDNGIYFDVQVYVEDLEKIVKESRSLKRGPHYKYAWNTISKHARAVAKNWRGSQNKFLKEMGDWIELQWPDLGRPTRPH